MTLVFGLGVLALIFMAMWAHQGRPEQKARANTNFDKHDWSK